MFKSFFFFLLKTWYFTFGRHLQKHATHYYISSDSLDNCILYLCIRCACRGQFYAEYLLALFLLLLLSFFFIHKRKLVCYSHSYKWLWSGPCMTQLFTLWDVITTLFWKTEPKSSSLLDRAANKDSRYSIYSSIVCINIQDFSGFPKFMPFAYDMPTCWLSTGGKRYRVCVENQLFFARDSVEDENCGFDCTGRVECFCRILEENTKNNIVFCLFVLISEKKQIMKNKGF